MESAISQRTNYKLLTRWKIDDLLIGAICIITDDAYVTWNIINVRQKYACILSPEKIVFIIYKGKNYSSLLAPINYQYHCGRHWRHSINKHLFLREYLWLNALNENFFTVLDARIRYIQLHEVIHVYREDACTH